MLFNRSGDLYNRLYEEGLITSLGFSYDNNPTYAYVSISGESRDPDAVQERIMAAVADAQKNGLSRTAFTRCKRVMYADFVKEFDSTSDIAELMLEYLFAGIEPLSYAELLDAVTFEEIEALLAEVFRPEAYAMSVVYPQEV